MDNRYYNYNCPPLMNDGRFISNYVRSSTFDQYIKNFSNVSNATEYRHYLQNNGSTIMNNIKGYLHQNNTCSVEGKCLPMSGPTTPIILQTEQQGKWYDELLDEEPAQLDFMMTNSELKDDLVPSNLQPTVYPNKECSTCTRN